MSESILKENPNDDLEVLVNDIQMHFKERVRKIEERNNKINDLKEDLNQENISEIKDSAKVKGIAKGVAAAIVKTAADVELIASQEDPLMGIETLSGLLERIKKGLSSKEKVTEEEGNKLTELVSRIKGELEERLDSLEKRVEALDNKNIHNGSKAIKEATPINNLGDAYRLINEMYDDLTKRFDELEKRLDRIEKGIEKKLKNNLNTYDYGPTAGDMLYELDAQARDRAAELGIEAWEEPNPFKPAYSNFKFGKFDANVLFNAVKGRTDDEFKVQLYSTYNDADKADSEYKMQSRRIEKLKEKGYIEIKDGKYEITDKGKEAAKEVNKKFKFTSYDADVVFGYVNKNDGQLSLEKLKESLKKEYKTEYEMEKQYSYLLKRIANNEKEGYLAKNTEGNYMITDKGKSAANRVGLKKNKKRGHNDIAL